MTLEVKENPHPGLASRWDVFCVLGTSCWIRIFFGDCLISGQYFNQLDVSDMYLQYVPFMTYIHILIRIYIYIWYPQKNMFAEFTGISSGFWPFLGV